SPRRPTREPAVAFRVLRPRPPARGLLRADVDGAFRYNVAAERRRSLPETRPWFRYRHGCEAAHTLVGSVSGTRLRECGRRERRAKCRSLCAPASERNLGSTALADCPHKNNLNLQRHSSPTTFLNH